jgi:Protein of unknown function (DUF3830)
MSQQGAGDGPTDGASAPTGSERRPTIECGFAGRGPSFVVELASEEAPSSVAALLERLPLDSDTYHTKWCGREFFVVLPPFDAPASERPTAEVRIGDVVVVHRDATDRTAPWRLRAAGLGAYVELAFFYGDGCRLFGPTGTVPGTRVGRIVGDLTALSRAVGEMRTSGFERLTARRRA